MYYHGWASDAQKTKVAVSKDGISFTAGSETLGRPYFRVFQWSGYYYALGMPGVLYRSRDGLTGFEVGPTLFTKNMRHSALELDGTTLKVYFPNALACPESILLSTIDLTADWMRWKASEPETILEPATGYEGGQMPLAPSKRGDVMEKVRKVRDPAIFQDGDETYLLYSVAGEQGIAIAKLNSD